MSSAPAAEHSPSFAPPHRQLSVDYYRYWWKNSHQNPLKPRCYWHIYSGQEATTGYMNRVYIIYITLFIAGAPVRGAAAPVQSAPPTINQCSGQVWNLKIRRFDELAWWFIVCVQPPSTDWAYWTGNERCSSSKVKAWKINSNCKQGKWEVSKVVDQ